MGSSGSAAADLGACGGFPARCGQGVSWALRQIGKRNRTLNRAAVACSQEIQALNNQAARWVASDVQRELLSPAVLMKLAK